MMDLNYSIPDGLTLVSQGQNRRVFKNSDGGYELVGEGHGVEVMTYKQVLSALKSPDAWAQNLVFQSNVAAARIRCGGLFYVEQLNEKQQDEVAFRQSLCIGLAELQKEVPRLTQAYLNLTSTRQKLRAIARCIYTKHPIDIARRGGGIVAAAWMPLGRTLLKYFKRYVQSGYDPMALADQSWLKGNRNRRISATVIDLIYQAIEPVDFDTRKRSVRAIHKKFVELLEGENARRTVNGLEPLESVCYSTILDELKKISPTARAIARDGIKSAVNTHSRGVTDTRALMLGDYAEIDECKISLMSVSKRSGWFAKLDESQKGLLKEVDEIIHSRLFLVLIIDVASRMPLGWVLTESPNAEATCAALRMAMRDKTKEKVKYGCICDPMPPIGICMLKNDNGAGLRNSLVKTAAVGLNVQTVDARTYRGGDKPHVERMFGTMEDQLFAFLLRYAGRRAGALSGYDPIKNGVLDVEELYGLITRYLVDEYPLQRHTGTTMMGRRPIEAAKQIEETEGAVFPPAAHDLRIHLGFKHQCKITHEGVKAFGLPFNSVELQRAGETFRGKVTVFVNPDDIGFATILLEGHLKPILAELSWTEMKDLTLSEFFIYAQLARAEDPQLTKGFEETMNRVRRERADHMARIAAEKKLPRSFMTYAEAQKLSEELLTGVHSSRTVEIEGAVTPGSLSDPFLNDGRYDIKDGFEAPIEQQTTPTQEDPFSVAPEIDGKLT